MSFPPRRWRAAKCRNCFSSAKWWTSPGTWVDSTFSGPGLQGIAQGKRYNSSAQAFDNHRAAEAGGFRSIYNLTFNQQRNVAGPGMKIGILGAGNIGAAAARLFIAAGHDVALSNSRGPESLKDLVRELG